MFLKLKLPMKIMFSVFFILISAALHAETTLKNLKKLKQAYPDFIIDYNSTAITWRNGEKINLIMLPPVANNSPSLLEQINQADYPPNSSIICAKYIPNTDPGRIRNEDFFSRMYGYNEKTVTEHLVLVYWMPKFFQQKYPLLVTSINGVDKKLKNISNQLELLLMQHPEFMRYLDKPSGTFSWRQIENSHRRSPHSYGIAIDLNPDYTNYWIWDSGLKVNDVNQLDYFSYKNNLPCAIVTIFENNGFIWGGKWRHYDTMHFEYRPELLIQ